MNSQKQGKAIPLVTYQNKKFVIDPEAEELLKSPEFKTVGIISLVGKYRTGKSFLLNRVLLNQKNLGFDVGPTIRPCTKGIWIWSQPITIENNNFPEKFQVFMIDTEGLGAYDEEINHDTRIFLIAVLISSLFIYNSIGTIDENSLNSLSFILNLSKTIKISNNSSSTDPNELAEYFPTFFWLLRDFVLKLEDNQGNQITSKQYLENCLKFQKSSSQESDEKNKLRKLIMTYFPERECYTLVRPLENEEKLQQLMVLEDSEFRKEFIEQTENLRNKVYQRVKPKTFCSKILSGEMVVNLLKSIVDSINSGSVPVIENTWKYVCENEGVKNYNAILGEFKEKIRKFKEKNQENMNFFSEFENFQRSLTKESIDKYKEMTLSNEMLEFCDKLKYAISSEIKKFSDENSSFYEKKLREILDINIKKINDSLDIDAYSKNYYEFFQDLANLKDTTESSVPDFISKKEIIFDQLIMLVKRFIEVTFIRNKSNSEREIINLKNELNNLNHRNKILNEENENTKIESKEKITKLNETILNLKLEETSNLERIKVLENEKKNLLNKIEKEVENANKISEGKLDKLNSLIEKLNYDLKAKEDQIVGLNFSIDKINTLNNQKIEFLESEVSSYKSRFDQIKQTNMNLMVENEMFESQIEELKAEVSKKKMLEYELEKLKNKEKKIDENQYFSKTFGGDGFFNPRASGTIEKNDIAENQFKNEENRKILEDGFNFIKATLQDLPNNILKLIQKNDQDKSRILQEEKKNEISVDFTHETTLIEKSERNLNSKEKEKPDNQNMDKNHINAVLEYAHERCVELEEKIKKIKNFKKMVKSSTSLQCKNCFKIIQQELFLSHIDVCFEKSNFTEIKEKSFKIKLIKYLIPLEVQNKNAIEYIFDVFNGETNFTLNRNLNNLINFAKILKKEFTLIQIAPLEKCKLNTIEDKTAPIEKFLESISSNEIRNSMTFKKFFSNENWVDEPENDQPQLNQFNTTNQFTTNNNIKSSKTVIKPKNNSIIGVDKFLIKDDENKNKANLKGGNINLKPTLMKNSSVNKDNVVSPVKKGSVAKRKDRYSSNVDYSNTSQDNVITENGILKVDKKMK